MASNMESAEKPKILVLGGVGMIGRNFVKWCVDNDVCSFIRVADKAMTVTSYFSASHLEAFASDIVQTVQSDLTKDDHIDRVFNRDGHKFNFVFNFAAETRYGQPESAYQSKCLELSTKCARAAAAHGVEKFIEISTAQVYKSNIKHPSNENAEIQPWTLHAQFKYEAERQVLATDGLSAVVLRLSTVYGPGDVSGLMPRAVCAVGYQHLGEQMKFLWDAQTRLNTVHVLDVCRAAWHSALHLEAGSVFNLADKTDTDQGKINQLLGRIFGIRTGFLGKMLSNMARINLSGVVDTANDKHMAPWSTLCQIHNINNTPLSPFMHRELLSHNHLYVDGSAIEATGFNYDYPLLTEELLRESIVSAIEQGIFPPTLEISGAGVPEEKKEDES